MTTYRSGGDRLSTFSFWDNRFPRPMLYLDLASKKPIKTIKLADFKSYHWNDSDDKPLSYHGLQFCWSATATPSSYSKSFDRLPSPNLYGLLLFDISENKMKYFIHLTSTWLIIVCQWTYFENEIHRWLCDQILC